MRNPSRRAEGATTSLLRALSLLMVPVLGGCISGCGGHRELPPVEYSEGFFAAFDQMIDETMSRGSLDDQARTLDIEFARRVDEGPGLEEVVAVGATWEKVETFLSIGLLSAEIMAPIEGSAQSRVDMFEHAADRVLRSDTTALVAWNRTVRDMGFSERKEPTGEIVWESLYLVLGESEHAYQDVWVESGTWVEGSWVHTDGYYEQLWIDGYYESVWQEGACSDAYVGTECDTYYVEESCYDVWIDEGYWESTCSAYDEEGNCVEWSDAWVSTGGYYETECDPAYSYEECTDVYETVCEPGEWLDTWIEGHWIEGAWIPGELVWVEGYWSDTSGYRTVALPVQEAEILDAGITYVASFGPERVGDDCYARLDEALVQSAESPPESDVKLSRDAILACLSPR
ncbi:hypothetical protein [Polyangium sp. 6x1]|uniref:hypothetical protein n=1 Tax=Polyangium sp. 6x1 TaxID=3042689 RepID=UPI002482F246|nr:hypothetical protein [Polyangium sp. 6x1]MDI1451690.1 hypothetical protein [Polyangium sp. 6x1]